MNAPTRRNLLAGPFVVFHALRTDGPSHRFQDAPPGGRALTLAAPGSFAAFQPLLLRAVETCFPGFGYAPDEIARFLGLNAEPYDDVHLFLEEDGETVGVAMRCGDLLEYVVPLDWGRRYEIVDRAVRALKADRPKIHLRIAEDFPSHAAWSAALLPGIGFGMTPRVRMVAPTASLLAPSRDGTLTEFHPSALDACVALHLRAFGVTGTAAAAMERGLRDAATIPDRRSSWVVARDEDAIVGSCFGSHHRDRLFIEELAVAPSHRRRGLGRRLLLETARRLAEGFPEAATAVLDVDRTNVPATRLYAALGFVPQARYTVAACEEV